MSYECASIINLDRDETGGGDLSVPKSAVDARSTIGQGTPDEPQTAERPDLAQVAMLGFAGLLTFLWIALLAWGAVRLLEATLP